MRIADQVIEEVDEQLTIQSQRAPDKRPTAQSIFATCDEKQPIRSDPIDVPSSHHNNHLNYDRAQSVLNTDHQPYMFPNNALFSSSAPEEHTIPLQTPTINIDNTYDIESGSQRGIDKSKLKTKKIKSCIRICISFIFCCYFN